MPWPTDGLRRASVNSFGFGGANCDVILDDAYNSLRLRGITDGNHQTAIAPPRPEMINSALDDRFVDKDGPSQKCASTNSEDLKGKSNDSTLLVWSSGDEDGINRTRESWETYFSSLIIPDSEKNTYTQNLAHTLALRRSHLKWRSFAVIQPSKSLRCLASEFSPAIKSSPSPRVAFIFTGVSIATVLCCYITDSM